MSVLDARSGFAPLAPRPEVTRAQRWRMKLSRAVQDFLNDNRVRWSSATRRAYESDLHRLVAMVSIDSVLALTPDMISSYFQWCSVQGQKPATLHRKYASLGELCRWGMRKRLWAESPMRDQAPIPKPERVPRPFARDEMARLMALALSPLEHITRQLLAYTGLRVTPICELRVADCSFAPTTIQGVTMPGAIRSLGKGNKPHVIPMVPALHGPLYDYVLQHTDLKGQSWLLQQARGRRPVHRRIVEGMTQRWGVRAEVPTCIPHRFRHTVATRLLEEGVDIRVIREILAHADINDTMLYTKVANVQIASAMLRLPADWTAPLALPPGPGPA